MATRTSGLLAAVWGATVMLGGQGELPSHLLARLTIMALRASDATIPDTANLWVLAGSSEPLTLEALVMALAARPKPLVVEALWDGRVIRVKATVMRDPEEQRIHRETELRSFQSLAQFVSSRYGAKVARSRVQVRSLRDSVEVPLETLRDWFLQYRIVCSASSTGRLAIGERDTGASMVMTLSSARGLHLDVVVSRPK